jgi:hypothetical protein
MTDGILVCDSCNTMQGSEDLIELWPAQTLGAYGPGRIEAEAFHVCMSCIRRRFGMDRKRAMVRDRRARQAGWHLSGSREHAQATAEAAGRDAELSGQRERVTDSQHQGLTPPQWAGSRSIMAEYVIRHGAGRAWQVACYSVDVLRCLWMGTPITIRRFTPSHDELFTRAALAEMSRNG